jgi:CsoR family transcriptional regulator, copper-sensing transcriptional repressor
VDGYNCPDIVGSSPEVSKLQGYIKAANKQRLAERLERIEGQVRGIKRMVDREAYCIDIVTQITSLVAASEKVASILIQDHVDYCIRGAIEDQEEADEKIAELTAAIERFLRV